MKQYKLIKTYPGCYYKKDTIVHFTGSNYRSEKDNTFFFIVPDDVENHPDFWQEINKDWEILCYSQKENRNSHSLTKRDNSWDIHSIKRSDGEIFTIGDMTTGSFYDDLRSIENFIVQYDNSIEVKQKYGITKLKDLVKAKQPLFTTEDSIDIYPGDYFYWVNPIGSFLVNQSIAKSTRTPNPNNPKFSTKKAAEEYALMNKPCLSIADLSKIDRSAFDNSVNFDINVVELKELVKSKL